ncbi:cAMP-independent regulatory protein pac2 [Ceratobasidium sp. AG-Ba]|nr:cAMP-independent regulatory protein pac2 [Ceratobasidium sp. AG-Ba]
MQTQQATCTNVHIRTTHDAHRIFHATLLGIYKPITRRLDIEERRLVKPGACFVWEERGPDAEATGMGIERWTDGLRWGPSRVRDDFLFYHQRDTEADDEDRIESGDGGRAPPAKWLKKFARRRKADEIPHHGSSVSPRLSAPGAIDRSSDRENDRLIKQTYSVFATIPGGGRQQRKWHITAYFTQGTIEFLRTVDQIPELATVSPPPGTYRSARATGSKKNQEPVTAHIPEYPSLRHLSHVESPPIQWPPYASSAGPSSSTPTTHRPASSQDFQSYPSPEPLRHLPHPLSPVEMRPSSASLPYPTTPTSRGSVSPFARTGLPLPVRSDSGPTRKALEDVYLPPLSVSPYPYVQRNATDDKQLDALLRQFMVPGSHSAHASPMPPPPQ